MKRSIKFRMWCETSCKYFYEPQEVLFCLANASREPELYQDMTWEQFTGVLDWEGKEIYEGDILEFHDYKGFNYVLEVAWISENENHDWTGWNIGYDTTMKSGKIIGNIHQNPDILKSV